jgi:hypothetical protein
MKYIRVFNLLINIGCAYAKQPGYIKTIKPPLPLPHTIVLKIGGDGMRSIRSYAHSNSITQSMQSLHDEWRLLWEQHVAWTRMTIISDAFDLPILTATSTRLLRNASDMGALMRAFYGEGVAARFTQLIHDHLQIAINLVAAAKAGDTARAAQIEREWYENADEIARFMSRINRHWSQRALRDMLHRHLALTKDEAVAILSGDYQKSVELYDEIELQALMMADAFSAGIIADFPQVFR